MRFKAGRGSFSFTPNPGMEEQIERNPLMYLHMKRRAEDGAQRARDIAPVDEGDYRDSIEGVAGMHEGRFIGRVNAKDFKSHWIEFGTSAMQAFAVLRRAIGG